MNDQKVTVRMSEAMLREVETYRATINKAHGVELALADVVRHLLRLGMSKAKRRSK